MRPSDKFFLLVSLLAVGMLATFADVSFEHDADRLRRDANRALVAQLGLTDPALFSEARYVRHLSQTDLHTPFQDHPMAFEHFPSGSLIQPPGAEHWR